MRVAVLDDYEGLAATCDDWSRLGRVDVLFYSDHCETDEELVERLSYADVVVTTGERTTLTAAILELLPGVQLVVTLGPNNAVDLPAATELGIAVSATEPPVFPDGNAEPTPTDYRTHYARAVDIIEAFRAGDVILARN